MTDEQMKVADIFDFIGDLKAIKQVCGYIPAKGEFAQKWQESAKYCILADLATLLGDNELLKQVERVFKPVENGFFSE